MIGIKSPNNIPRKNCSIFWIKTHYFYLCNPIENGRVAEWLGRGLQNLVQRFESARDLQ